MRACIWILTYLAAVAGSAAQTPPVSIAGADANQLIKITVDASSFSGNLLLQAVDNRGMKQVTVKANPWIGPGQQWVQPQAVWAANNQTGDIPQDIPPLGEKTLKVAAPLSVPGKYTGTLDLIYETSRHTFRIEVERSAPAELTIRDKEITVDHADVDLLTAIQSKGTGSVRQVTVDVHALIGPDTRQVVPTVKVGGQPVAGAAVDIPPNGQVPLQYTATLPIPGKYTGVIDLVYGLKRQPEPITITRSDATIPVKIRPIESTQADSFPLIANSAVVRVLLEGTRSETITLNRPAIPSFSRKETEKVNKSAICGPILIQQAADDGKLAPLGGTLTLNGRKSVDLRITIPGLSPGEYSGIFSAGSSDLAALEPAFTVYVRYCWFVAGLIIALSVLGSYFLRRWAISDRPRLEAQRIIAQLSADVDRTRAEVTDATPDERNVLDAFSQRLGELFNAWNSRKPAEHDAVVREIGDKLPVFVKWVNLRRRFDHAELPLAIMQAMRRRLTAFADEFPVKTTTADTLSAAIEKLRIDLAQALGAAIAEAIKTVRDDLTDQKKTAAGEAFGDKLDQEVVPRLDQAADFAKSEDTFAQAVVALDDARLIYTRILASALDAQLPVSTPDPQNIPQDGWNQMLTAVRDELTAVQRASDPNTAAAAYARAYSTYLKRLLDAAKVRLDAAPEKVDRSVLSDAEKTAARQDIAAAEGLVSDCAALLATHDITAAAVKYEQLRKGMTDIQTALKRGNQQMRAADGNVMADPPAALSAPNPPAAAGGVKEFASLPSRTGRIPSATVDDLQKRIRRGEAIVAWIAGILAVAIGIKLLWVPTPTWGTPADCITAVLWGFGLHQVSGAAMGQFDWNRMLTNIGSGGNAQS